MNAQTLSDTVVFSLITALVLVIAVALVYYFYRSRERRTTVELQQKLALEERFRNATWSSAVVIASSSMAAEESGHGNIRVNLELDVEGPEGLRYPAKTIWWVDPGYLGMLRPGESVLIRIDQQDAMRIYPNVNWAQPLEWDQE